MDNKFILITDPGTGRMMQISRLIARYINGNLNSPETEELKNWLIEKEVNRELFRYVTDPVFLNRLIQEKYN